MAPKKNTKVDLTKSQAPQSGEKKVEIEEASEEVEMPELDDKTKKATLRFMKTYGCTSVRIQGFDFTAESLGASPKGTKKVKKEKDPNAPKSAGSAYFCYLASFSEDEKKKIGAEAKADGSTYQKAMSEKWAALSDKKKKPFVEQYEAKKLVYLEEKKKYEASKKSAEKDEVDEEEAEDEEVAEEEPVEEEEEKPVEEEKPKKEKKEKKHKNKK